jgi:hypothetical protein
LRLRLRCDSPRSAQGRPDFLDERIKTSAIRKEGCVDLLTAGRGVARGRGRESGRIFRFLAQASIPAFADTHSLSTSHNPTSFATPSCCSLRSTPHARSVARKFHILVTGSIIGAEEGALDAACEAREIAALVLD